MSIKNILRGSLLATVATLAISATANATITAYADIELSNLAISITPPSGAVNGVTIGATSSTSFNYLTGTSSQSSNGIQNGLIFDANGVAAGDTSGMTYIGTTEPTANTYTNYTATSGRQTFSYADSYLTVFNTPGGVLDTTSTSTARTTAQAELNGTTSPLGGTGATSTAQNTTNFQVTPNGASISFSFNYKALFGAAVSATDHGSAISSGDFTVTIWGDVNNDHLQDAGDQFYSFSLAAAAGQNFTQQANNPGDNSVINIGGPSGTIPVVWNFFSGGYAGTTGFLSNTNYQLATTLQTHVDVARVPEPVSLGLFGTGLVAMGRFLRRRKAA